MRSFSTLIALLPFTVGAAGGCISADVSDRDFADAAPGTGDASPGMGADGDLADGTTDPPPPPPPPGCDASADPKDAPACVVDSYGMFVDTTSGADTNPGTSASPLKSVTAALAKRANKARVYICEGSYDERVKLTSAVSLYAGFACGTWIYSGKSATFAPSAAGYALEIASVSGSLVVSDVEMIAVPGAAGAPSSVAAFVDASPNIVLQRVRLTAGQGFDGTPGADATTGAPAGSLDGNPATNAAPGLQKTCACSNGGQSTGGAGGKGNVAGMSGAVAMATPSPAGADGAGQVAQGNCASASPHRGSDAPMANSASSPALGSIAADGWHPGDGTRGDNGIPGQGGGGGSAVPATSTSSGGGGACGGCAGSGGGGGSGGGSSIALLLLDSPVKILASELTSAAGGTGGAGKPGAGGQGGGLGGGPGPTGCAGAEGGTGGTGGAGSGGAGGLSVGVLYKGSGPILTMSTMTTSAFGSRGAGGVSPTNDGPDGKSAQTLEIP